MKTTSSSSKNLENRLLGLERRATKLEDKVDDFRRDLVHNTVQIDKMSDSFIKMEDRFMKEFEEFRSKIFTLIDPLFGQLKKFNEEQTVHEGQHEEIYQDVQKLKQIHPNNTHQPLVA